VVPGNAAGARCRRLAHDKTCTLVTIWRESHGPGAPGRWRTITSRRFGSANTGADRPPATRPGVATRPPRSDGWRFRAKPAASPARGGPRRLHRGSRAPARAPGRGPG
jgi:hypothetical protein